VLKHFKFFELLDYLGIRNIMSFHSDSVKYFGYLCHKFLWICKTVISLVIENETTGHIDWDALHHLYYYQPGGTSTKNLIHWMQFLGTDQARQFDYGIEGNKLKYNSTVAPNYDLEILKEMRIPIFITTSDGDPYCIKEDFGRMMETFKNTKVTVQHAGKYNHLDYLWGKNAYKDIYSHLLNFLNDK
jgi:hypothetical protein